MALTAKGSRSVTVDGICYRWRMGRGWPSAFAAELPGHAGAVLLATISDCPRTDWCRDGVGLVVTRAAVPVVIRSALDHGWQPAVHGPAFRVEVPFSELPSSVTAVSSHLDWCCEYRFIARLQVNGKPAIPAQPPDSGHRPTSDPRGSARSDYDQFERIGSFGRFAARRNSPAAE